MDLNHDNDWYRYFGDSTIHTVGRHGYVVRMPRDSKSCEKDRGEDGSETEDSGRLGQNHAGYSD